MERKKVVIEETVNKKNNTFCIISIVFAGISYILQPAGLPPILAVLFGGIGMAQYDTKKEKNYGFGLAGIIIGILYFINYLYQYGYLDN